MFFFVPFFDHIEGVVEQLTVSRRESSIYIISHFFLSSLLIELFPFLILMNINMRDLS